MSTQTSHKPSLMRTWTLRRGFAIAVSLLFLGFGATCIFDGIRMSQDFEKWLTAKPMEGPIDFSAPGNFAFPFNQTCSSSHGESVSIVIPDGSSIDLTESELLAGLEARLEIMDEETSEMVASAASEVRRPDELVESKVHVFNLAPFRKGTYLATVTLTSGAAALKGVPQRIEGSYQLCGLEKLPAHITLLFGVISSGIGILIALMVLARIAKSRKAAILA